MLENKINLEVIYKIVPQMRNYYEIGKTYFPYLMFFQNHNYRSEVVNTDNRGFRYCTKENEIIKNFNNKQNLPLGLLVGNSLAFGVGAAGDRYTIPSMLNDISDLLWFNLGGRACNMTQELLLFLFYRPLFKNIKKVIIVSGINDLSLYHLSKKYSRDFGAFFFSEDYQNELNKLHSPIHISDDIKLSIPKAKKKNKNDLLYILKRELTNWKLLSRSLGFDLYFVLQPFALWLKNNFSEEEKLLFKELDKQEGDWHILKQVMDKKEYLWFANSLQKICESKNIPFMDLNSELCKYQPDEKWLFVDRIHLTNSGYRLVSNILNKHFLK